MQPFVVSGYLGNNPVTIYNFNFSTPALGQRTTLDVLPWRFREVTSRSCMPGLKLFRQAVLASMRSEKPPMEEKPGSLRCQRCLAGVPVYARGREDYPQLDFGNVIAVDPNDENSVYVGQILLWRATDGGNSGMWDSSSAFPPLIHVDVHAIVFDPGDSSVFYVAHDGGVDKGSLDPKGGFPAFELLTGSVALGQSGSVGPAPFNFNSVISGLWNNGGAMTNDLGQTWIKVGGCDAGRGTIDAEPEAGITTAYTDNCGTPIRRNQIRSDGVNIETIWSGETSGFWSNPYIPGELLRANTDKHPTAPGALFITEFSGSPERNRIILRLLASSMPLAALRSSG